MDTSSENNLLNQNHFLRTTLESIPDTILIIDRSCKVYFFNKVCQDSFMHDFFKIPSCQQRITEAFDSKHNSEFEITAENRTKLCRTILLNDFDRLMIIITDITLIKKNDDAIKRLSLIAKHDTNAAVIFDLDGHLLWGSDAFSRITGYSQQEIQNKKGSFLHGPETDPSTIQYINRQIAHMLSFDCDILYYKKNGEQLWVNISAQPIFNEQSIFEYYFAIERDVTFQKQMELKLIAARKKAEESEKLKSSFLANMSHEIRTPLNAILGFSELLSNSALPLNKRREFVRLSKVKARDLLDIINNILEVSRLEAGQWKVNESPANIAEKLKEVFQEFKIETEYVNKKDINLFLQLSIDPDSQHVMLDYDLLKHVVYNLLNNALKFTHDGFIELGCKLLNKEKILIYVRDSGIGIPEHNQKIIFEPFRQSDESIHRKYGGNGLGLTLCKKLLDLIGGEIWLESRVNIGTTFYFTIPYKPSKQLPLHFKI